MFYNYVSPRFALQIVVTGWLISAATAYSGMVATVAGGVDIGTGKRLNKCTEAYTGSKDGKTTSARFHYPWGIAYDPIGKVLYVADCGCSGSARADDRIRKVDIKTGHVTTLAGSLQGYEDGIGENAKFHHPAGMSMHRKTRTLFVCDSANHRIRTIDVDTGKVTTFVGSGKEALIDGKQTNAAFNNPQAVAVDHVHKDRLFVADTDNHAIREVSLPDGEVTTLAGGSKGLKNGIGKYATFYHPAGVTIDPNGYRLFIADHYNHVIRIINLENNMVTTLAGSGKPGFIDGIGTQAMFEYPEGMVYDTDYNILYVVEFSNHCIRTVSEQGEVKLFVGGKQGRSDGEGEEASFFHPTGMTYDEENKIIYITDQYNHLVRSISAIGSKVSPPGTMTIEKVVTAIRGSRNTGTVLITLTFILFSALVIVCICRRQGRRMMSKI
ncbi:NHL repeat-containing protein 2-like [Glandiceps talaboti]